MKGKKLNTQKSSAPSTSAKLKVKLPTIKSTSKDIADDLKAIREALNLKPDVSPKRKKTVPLQQKSSRKRSPIRSVAQNGHDEDTKPNVDDIMFDLAVIKPEFDDVKPDLESRQVVGQNFNGSPQRVNVLVQNFESSPFVSPTGRPMRSRKPNQRYTDLLSETEPGRRRRTSSKHSTTSNDEDVAVYHPVFDRSPIEQKAKMKKTKKRKNDAAFAKPVVVMPSPVLKVKTLGLPKKERARKQWKDLKPDTIRKYLGKLKKERKNKAAEVILPPTLIKGEFEQPPEFFEIQERALSPVDLDTNMMNMIESDDNLPPILPISALMARPLSPGPAPKSPPLQKKSPLNAIVPIPNSLLNSSGELDFSQFAMSGDELPQSSQHIFASVPKVKKPTVKKGPPPPNKGLNNNSSTTFAKGNSFMLSNYNVPSSFGEIRLQPPTAAEKPPPKQRRSYTKNVSRTVQQREEKIMRMETEEALQGIKTSVQDVQDPDDIVKQPVVNVVKPNKIRRGRYSNVTSVARFVDDSVIYGPSVSSQLNRVSRPLPPRPLRMNFDDAEKFCSLPPQVAGDHCYGKQQTTPKADPMLTHGGYGGVSETSSSRRSYEGGRPPSLTKSGNSAKAQGGGNGKRPRIVHHQPSPSPPPYNHLIHGLSPTYTNDPSLGAYYGATDDGYSDEDGSNNVGSLPVLNKSGNNLGARLPSRLLDDDVDDSDASDERITRVDIQ